MLSSVLQVCAHPKLLFQPLCPPVIRAQSDGLSTCRSCPDVSRCHNFSSVGLHSK